MNIIRYSIDTELRGEELIKKLSRGMGYALLQAGGNGKLKILKCLVEMKSGRLMERLSNKIGDVLICATRKGNRKPLSTGMYSE